MAIDNGCGEMIPDRMRVRLGIDSANRLIACEAEQSDWEPPGWGARVSTVFTQEMYESDACVPRGQVLSDPHHTLRLRRPAFVFLDCGRWGGSPARTAQRNFGLVCGSSVALCNFVPQGGSLASVDPDPDHPLNQVIRSLTVRGHSSVQVIKHVRAPSRVRPDSNTIYIFLGDLHLPIYRGFPTALPGGGRAPDGPAMGRGGYTASNTDGEGRVLQQTHMDRNPTGLLGEAAMGWFRNNHENDIFHRADSDLLQFAALLSGCSLQSRMHLVQLGDMYDFWIGLDRYFDGSTEHRMILRSGARGFVNFWTARTNALFAPLIQVLTGGPIARKTWLYGNHDNYFAEHTPPGVPQRVRQIRGPGLGIFAEHGHRGDSSNRDGATSGHDVTQRVFRGDYDVDWRSFDPNRRPYWTTTAAISFAREPDFNIYVMGHTHSPFLTEIQLEMLPMRHRRRIPIPR